MPKINVNFVKFISEICDKSIFYKTRGIGCNLVQTLLVLLYFYNRFYVEVVNESLSSEMLYKEKVT